MLLKFLACGLAALALVGATPFQGNMAVREDAAVTAGIAAGNYYLVNAGTNETLFGQGKGRPVYTKSTVGTPDSLGQWKLEPGAGSNEYKFFNIGLNSSTSRNNGHLYVSYGPTDLSLTHVVTPAQGKADMFIITTPQSGTWTNEFDTSDKQDQVFFAPNTGSAKQLWKFVPIN